MEYRGVGVESWWLLAIAGVLSILFGLALLFWPGITVLTILWIFAIYAIIYGIVELVNMFRAMGEHTTWWTHLLIGLIGLAAGIVAFAWPGITSLVLLYLIAFWAIAAGIVEAIAGLVEADLGWVIVGVITALFGFILLVNPLGGATALVFVIGIFALVRGILLLIAAIRAPSAATPVI